MATDFIRRDCLTCHTFTIYKWVLANFCMLDVKSLQNYHAWYEFLAYDPAGFIWSGDNEINWILALLELILQINKRANGKPPWHQNKNDLFYRVLHILSTRITI